MVFVFKDYLRKVEHVNSIPMTSLDSVKEWLKYVGNKTFDNYVTFHENEAPWPKITFIIQYYEQHELRQK